MRSLRNISLLLGALVVFGSCSKSKPDPVEPAKTKAKYYFSAKLNGADYLVEDLVNGYGSGLAVPSGSGSVPGTYQVEMGMILMNPAINQGAGVSISKVFSSKPTECDEVKPMYKLGKYAFGNSGDYGKPSADGAIVFYVDANGTYWTSDQGTADQTGSNFEIVEHSANNDGYSLNISKAKFNCKLYDSNGNSMVVTNGEINGRSVTCDFL